IFMAAIYQKAPVSCRNRAPRVEYRPDVERTLRPRRPPVAQAGAFRGPRVNGAPGRNGSGAAPGGVVGVLQVIGGNDRGKTHPLTKPLTTIGRGADQDCILADIAVSRRH